MRRSFVLAALLAIFAITTAFSSMYVVSETEQVIITEFGRPVGGPITEAGLHFKRPYVSVVNRIDKQILAWDGQRTEMPTKDKLYILVDSYGRWRITQPLEYFRRLRDERSAQSRLDDTLGSETRNAIAKHDLIEVVRTTKSRQPERDASLVPAYAGAGKIGVLPVIEKGRHEIELEVLAAAKIKLAEFGIELLDVRFKRINYNDSVVDKIYERMISERQQIASRFRSEGEGEAAKILGDKQRDLSVIESEAYRTVQQVRGAADAEATEIYAAAYSQTAESRDWFAFVETLSSFRTVIDADSTLLLTTEGEFFRLLVDTSAANEIRAR